MLFVLNSIDWYQYKISEYGYKISIEVRESEYRRIVFGLGFSFGVLIFYQGRY